jgi:hypothetical protein
MTGPQTNKPDIHPEMTVLDVVAAHRSTQRVFEAYDQQAGICICCEALFERLSDLARDRHLDLEKLMADLRAAAD